MDWGSDGTVAQLFAAQVARAPSAIALIAGGASLDYAELDARVDRLARLLTRRGIGPERVVGVALPRSGDTDVAVLAIARAGGAYLPLDLAYPADRLRFMIESGRPALVVTLSTVRLPADPPTLALDDPLVRAELDAPRRAGRCATAGVARPPGVRDLHVGLHRAPQGRRGVLARNGMTPRDVDCHLAQNLSAAPQRFTADALDVPIAKACTANLRDHGHLGPNDLLFNLTTAIDTGELGDGQRAVLLVDNGGNNGASEMTYYL